MTQSMRRREDEDGRGKKRDQMVGDGDGRRQARRKQQRRAEVVLGKAPHLIHMVEMVLQPPPQDLWVQECAENISCGASSLGAQRLFLTECRFFPEFVQDAVRESYKYRSASCVALQGGSCFPSRGRGSECPWGHRQLCVLGGRDGGGSRCARAPLFLR